MQDLILHLQQFPLSNEAIVNGFLIHWYPIVYVRRETVGKSRLRQTTVEWFGKIIVSKFPLTHNKIENWVCSTRASTTHVEINEKYFVNSEIFS